MIDMKETRLTAERVRKLFHYDRETGELTRSVRVKRGACGQPPHRDANGYLKFCVDGRGYMAHRLIWVWAHGFWPSGPMDHIDGNPRNNRLENLRVVTHRENSLNQKIPRNNTSGRIGVHLNKAAGKWQAFIRRNGRVVHLGYFGDKQDAIAARESAEATDGYHPNHGRRCAW